MATSHQKFENVKSSHETLIQVQLEKLRAMLRPVLKTNAFYAGKLRQAGVVHAEDLHDLQDYSQLPFTTKGELSSDQAANPPYGANLTFRRKMYTRVHQTSGTTGEPLRWLDTEESWAWWGRCWQEVYRAAGVKRSDRVFFAFSFGPFIGFWSAYEGARSLGTMVIPGGGMSSYQRLKAIFDHEATVLICTPTYAMHLAEVAQQEKADISRSKVRITIHAGEPGAGLPMTRRRIEAAWGARCYDHAGATEVGAWGFECHAQGGLHINEEEFIFEVLDPVTLKPAQEGELVITNLGRIGMPIIRYRTGDHVKLDPALCPCGRPYHRFKGGVIGRADDVIIVRGVNLVPSAVENLVRRYPEVGEFAVDVYRRGPLDELEIRVELNGGDAGTIVAAVGRAVRNAFGLRVLVKAVPYGSLPRFDLKTRRFTDHRQKQ